MTSPDQGFPSQEGKTWLQGWWNGWRKQSPEAESAIDNKTWNPEVKFTKRDKTRNPNLQIGTKRNICNWG